MKYIVLLQNSLHYFACLATGYPQCFKEFQSRFIF